ncbi:uncharacterized protein UV8b_00708 [Ustilaginoidea virens]|uniref:Uncharacterized protein n=1 Tax=Ustilaginoidea virens TaxID=1159556 RepID=A0A8E5HJL0_USTVR|nr:uncharacterized protein UV8b_00708 [Ustilaginoidea virens]QUC16467.1 hypothetical protein UV8b_00708 [Ustilaginoidea virens]
MSLASASVAVRSALAGPGRHDTAGTFSPFLGDVIESHLAVQSLCSCSWLLHSTAPHVLSSLSRSHAPVFPWFSLVSMFPCSMVPLFLSLSLSLLANRFHVGHPARCRLMFFGLDLIKSPSKRLVLDLFASLHAFFLLLPVRHLISLFPS